MYLPNKYYEKIYCLLKKNSKYYQKYVTKQEQIPLFAEGSGTFFQQAFMTQEKNWQFKEVKY